MKLEDYIDKHTIIKIGMPSSEYVYCEVIVDDPKQLVSVARDDGYYISSIRWWHHANITAGSNIGYGGPKDPNCPDYYFAETDFCKQFDVFSQDEEYYKYIDEIKHAYPNSLLIPAFDIKKRGGQGDGLRKTGDGSL